MEKSRFTEAQIAYVLRRAASTTSASHCCLRKNRELDSTTRQFPTEQTVQMACISSHSSLSAAERRLNRRLYPSLAIPARASRRESARYLRPSAPAWRP